MSAFELPANIKQIGSIGAGLRIYMEDYACSYLQQYATAGGYDERLALLIGRPMVIDGQDILFISGAVQGRYIKIENGVSIFTPKSMDYANEMIKKYFRGMEVVGWAQTQPSYGVFLNTAYAEYHSKAFKEDYNVLFVMDPIEKVNCFYTYNTEVRSRNPGDTDTRDIIEAAGYFIYYDKNKGMHEYMLGNKTEPELTLSLPAEPEPELDPEPEAEKEGAPYEEAAAPELLIRNRQSVRSLKKATAEQKRVLNLLVTLSAVLFIICFIMGAGLIQNRDRISSMENQITQLSTSYRNLLVDLRENTASVFAANPDSDNQGTGQAATDPEAPSTVQGTGTDTGIGMEADTGQASLIQEDGNEALAALPPSQTEPPVAETPTPTIAPTDPPASNEAAATVNVLPDTYTVQEGDNLSYISMKFYGSKAMVDRIKEVNAMTDDTIYYGKVLKLPK